MLYTRDDGLASETNLMTRQIPGLFARGVRNLYASGWNSGKIASTGCVVLLALLAGGCARKSVHEPVTLVYLDQRMVNSQFQVEYEQEFQQFTQKTGIRVKFLAHPEATQDQLALWRTLLRTGSSGPDVYGIDVVWARSLSDDFIDLKPYFHDEISDFFPAVINSFTVNNKLIAIPHGSDVGLLFYRSDLLRKYGYQGPPGTWDELEVMAARIQAGERAREERSSGVSCGLEWPLRP